MRRSLMEEDLPIVSGRCAFRGHTEDGFSDSHGCASTVARAWSAAAYKDAFCREEIKWYVKLQSSSRMRHHPGRVQLKT